MAKIGRPQRRLDGFTGGDDYLDADSEPAQVSELRPAAAPAVEQETSAAPAPAPAAPAGEVAKKVKPVRKNWTFLPDFLDRLNGSLDAWLEAGVADGRIRQYKDLSEQAYVAALVSYAVELLEEDLKRGPNHGIAGSLEKYFPENATVFRGR